MKNIKDIINDYVNNCMQPVKIIKKYSLTVREFKKLSKQYSFYKLKKEQDRINRCIEFIEKSKKKFGDKFDYSKVPSSFKNYNAKIILIDNETKQEFKINPYLHLKFKNGGTPTDKKSYGYWNNKKHCEEEFQNFKNKRELMKNSYGCYKAASKNGWLKELSEKYFKENVILRHDSNERINCVYSYEYNINDKNYVYIGRTNCLKKRDKAHRNGYTHRNKTKTFDIVYTFAKENNLQIPEVKVLKDNLTIEESQYYEDFYRNEYLENGWSVLNKAKTGIGIGSLGSAIQKWTYDECKKEAAKYENRNKMKLANQSAYQVCLRKGYLNDFFGKSKKKPKGWWDVFEHCQEEASKYKNAKELSVKCGAAYQHAKKNGWILIYGKENSNK